MFGTKHAKRTSCSYHQALASPAHQLDRFSEKGLTCSLPLYKGALTLVIYPCDPDILEDPDFIAVHNGGVKWGEPHREPEKIYFQPVLNEESWKDKAPLIMF